jgi:hypothetical protein
MIEPMTLDQHAVNHALRNAINILYDMSSKLRVAADNPIWVFMLHAQKHLEKQIFFAEEQAFVALFFTSGLVESPSATKEECQMPFGPDDICGLPASSPAHDPQGHKYVPKETKEE